MAKISENDIQNLSQDWGKDEANGLPYSGRAIQKFIKETLGSKAGYFYYDPNSNRYFVFADEASKDSYLENPTLTGLVLGTFDAPFNYSAEINLTSEQYVAIPLGTTGNYIEFTFDTKNKNGSSVGEDIICTYTIIKGNNKKVVSQKYRYGSNVRFNVDGYLGEGTNRITIGIVGQDTLAATIVGVTYQVVNLSLSDNTNIAAVYDLGGEPQTLAIPFSVSGNGVKVVEWYLDGEKLAFDKNVDEVVDIASSRIKYIPLSDISEGVHHVEFRVYTVVNEERFYSRVLHRDIFVKNTGIIGAEHKTMIATAYEKDTLEDTSISLSQYLAYELEFAVHNPLNPESTEVGIYLGDTLSATLALQNGVVTKYSITPTGTGNDSIRIVASDVEYSLPVEIDENTMGIKEIVAGLELEFSASGKSNAEPNRGSWSDGVHSAVLTGVDYTQTSGWVNNRLILPEGAAIDFDYSPFASGATKYGKTLEFELASSKVEDDSAVLCNLIGTNGSGILLTASEAKIVSRGGVQLSVRYKSEENIRISFVINKAAGVTNKGLVFIYVNGIVSGAVNFASSDDFVSNANISFHGTSSAETILKQVRVYNAALSSEQILNNYILYRDTLAGMLEVFDRNDVYEDEGISFSVDKLQGQIPVMVVTGDIPALENTTNKNLQITVDIDYYNLQDPTRSFKMTKAAMRPQGTSSMLYPKKNFRIYTRKLDNTVLTVNGEVVEDKLYSFKSNAQPVDCWCLKADFAESSGTHNTGIARLWNDLLMNATVDGEHVFRTEAQKKALESDYPYDVRTTVDGFPILLFYRKNADSELIFIGKYNFNNDKSTESVFGFKGIPGFDNSHMQCWEVLNNGDALALFTDVSDFDQRWSEAYESRYPDTSSPNTADLKAFSVWVNSVKDNPTDFAAQKWEHLNVYMVAAYYVYLMRFGAVDQVVKNAMLTSEDGTHFYFINYDNDTINGLRNNGVLAFDPTIDRQSLDPDTGGLAYAYAGHDSVLWNRLEGDEEFMSIVREVDNALYTNGLRYDSVINMFDTEQANKWNESIYNQDAQYKYIGPYIDSGNNNLLMLQGKRQSHRRWWLSRRFSLYDSKFVSGDFKGKALEFKVINNTEPGWSFTIKAGTNMEYGYGVYNPIETGISLRKGESHTFTIGQTLNIGDPVRIYSAINLMGVDLSGILSRLSNIELNNVYNEVLGSKLTELVLGNGVTENTILTSISSINRAKRLEKLDIRGCKGIISMDLSELLYLKTVLTEGSGLTSIEFAKGAPITQLSISANMQVLRLEELPFLTTSNLLLEGNGENIHTLYISKCSKLSKDITLPLGWLSNKATPDEESVLYIDSIAWTKIDPELFLTLCTAKNNGVNMTLKGTVKLTTSSQEIIDAITNAFGSGVFRPGNELYVNAPDAIYLAGPDEILEGESAQFTAAVFSENYGTVTYSIIESVSSNISINPQTGLVITKEGVGDRTITIQAMHRPTQGSTVRVNKTLTIKQRVYPSNVSIKGSVNPNEDVNMYSWMSSQSPESITGNYKSEWTLSGDITEYVALDYSDKDKCRLTKIKEAAEIVTGTLKVVIKKVYNGNVVSSVSKTLQLLNPDIIMTSTTNSEVMAIMYEKGFAANETYMTKDEAESLSDTDLQAGDNITSVFYNKFIKTFNEFKYFTGITKCPYFYNSATGYLTEIDFPPYLTTINIGHPDFESLTIPNTIKNLILSSSLLTSIEVPSNVEILDLTSNNKLTSVILHEGLLNLKFSHNSKVTELTLPKSLETISNSCFYGTYIRSLVVPPKVNLSNLNTWFNFDDNSFALKELHIESLSPRIYSGYIFKYLDIFTVPENCETMKVIDGVIYTYNSSSSWSFVGICTYSGDPDTFIFGGGLRECFKYDSNSFNAKYFKQSVIDKLRDIKTFVFPQNLTFSSSNSDNFGNILKSFPNASWVISSDNTGLEVLENGLILKRTDAEKKYCLGALPQYSEITIEADVNMTFVNNCFSYSKFKKMTLVGDFSFTGSSIFAYADIEELYIQGSSELTIDRYCFEYSKLREIFWDDFPGEKRIISDYFYNAFSNCLNLKRLNATLCGKGNTSFYLIFAGCSALEEVKIEESTISSFYGAFSKCLALRHIEIHCATAPTSSSSSFGSDETTYTGRNTYDTGENILYVPAGATGYDTSYWSSVLCDPDKCGFTISYTL